MNLMNALLTAMLPIVSAAQTQSPATPALPSIAVPKTTDVLVIQTPKRGVTFQQVMALSRQRFGQP